MKHGLSRIRSAISLAAGLTVFLPAGSARAQTAEQQVSGLLQQAEQAYEQYLDIGSAQTSVEQALRLVQQYAVTGNAAALAYAMRGVIHVWMGEESQAIAMFKSALTNNPNVVIPASWGGPDIDAVMQKARQQMPTQPPPPPVLCPGGAYPLPNGTCPQIYQPPPPVVCPGGAYPLPNGTCPQIYQPPPPVVCPGGAYPLPDGTCPQIYQPPPPPPPAVPMVRHTPVTEQVWNHPVPIYIDVNPAITIGGVFLYYRAPGEPSFNRLEMGRAGGGYYVEVPCTILQPGSWDYYIMVVDPSGNPLAFEGGADQPHRVMMVQTISGLFPTRPDGSTLPDCGPDGTGRGIECPPGIPCGGVSCDRSCTFNDDCLSSEICLAGCCKARQEEEDDDDDDDDGGGGDPGFYLTLDLGLGLGIATGEAREPRWYVPASCDPGVPGSCDPVYGPDLDRQSVPIQSGIALSGFAARIGFGYFIIPELSLSANFRIGFALSGTQPDDFSWLGEARATWWFLSGPDHRLGAFVGGGAGVLNHAISKVVFQDNDGITTRKYEPFYKISGYGAIAFGMTYLYMLNDIFGLGGDLGMDLMVPEISFNFDLSFALALVF